MNIRTTVTLLGIALLICPVSIVQGQVNLSLLDDTWVREDSPDSNRNANDQVNARTDIDADDNDVILLRFSTSELTSVGLSSFLTLYWQRDDSGTGNSLSLWGLNETDPDESTWSELTVTYNNAPGLIPDGLNPTDETGLGNDANDVRDLDMSNLTLLVENQPYGPQALNTPYSFSGIALTDFVNADTNGQVTFLITRGELATSSNQARFWPKESGLAAELQVTVPEPSTIALLLGLGALAFVVRRRMS